MPKQTLKALIDNPAYIRCAMQAFEEGARAELIKEQCQCEAQALEPKVDRQSS